MQWGKIAIGRDATVTVTLPIAVKPINVQIAVADGSSTSSTYRSLNWKSASFQISVAAWPTNYFWFAICWQQWGRSTAATLKFPISFQNFFCITTAQESWSSATFENTSWIVRTNNSMTWPKFKGTNINYIAVGIQQWGTKAVSQDQRNVTVNYVLPVSDTFLITLTTKNTSDIGYNGSQVAFDYTRTGFTLSHTGKAQTKLYFAVCIAQQWGVSTTTSNAWTTVTLPIAFKSGYSVQAVKASSTSNAYVTSAVFNGTTTIQIYVTGTKAHWLAIGKQQ